MPSQYLLPPSTGETFIEFAYLYLEEVNTTGLHVYVDNELQSITFHWTSLKRINIKYAFIGVSLIYFRRWKFRDLRELCTPVFFMNVLHIILYSTVNFRSKLKQYIDRKHAPIQFEYSSFLGHCKTSHQKCKKTKNFNAIHLFLFMLN